MPVADVYRQALHCKHSHVEQYYTPDECIYTTRVLDCLARAPILHKGGMFGVRTASVERVVIVVPPIRVLPWDPNSKTLFGDNEVTPNTMS